MQAAHPGEPAVEPSQRQAVRDELRRILESPHFRGSRRCCRFLEYSVEHVLEGNLHEELRERNIGVEVFHRPPDYDTAEDAIVRVTANEVRKRLAQFYQESGQTSDPVIGLPPGSYAAAFRWKPPVASPPAVTQPEARPRIAIDRRWLILALVLAVGIPAAFRLYPAPAATASASLPKQPADPLWSSVFRTGEKTNIVIADAGRFDIQQLLTRDFRLEDYIAPGYPGNLAAGASPDLRRAVDLANQRETTSLGSTAMSMRLTELGRRYGVNAALRHPRHLNVREFKTDNFIILGSRLSIPWVELFEPMMNYRMKVDPESWTFYLENRAPQPGEPAQYRRSPSKSETWVDVAVLPGMGRSETVVIFNAIDMLGVEAAVEASIGGMLAHRLPHYGEILLRVRSIGGAASKTDVVSVRELAQKPRL